MRSPANWQQSDLQSSIKSNKARPPAKETTFDKVSAHAYSELRLGVLLWGDIQKYRRRLAAGGRLGDSGVNNRANAVRPI